MSASTSHSMSYSQFLTMAANLLYKAFVENSRTRAKNVYREILAGKMVALTTVEMEDKSTVRFDLALDHSEHRGTLNFGAFRATLTQLIASLGENLKKGEDIRSFNAEDDSGNVIFGVTALSQEGGNTNIMVLSADVAADSPKVLLKLLYLDPEQFAANVSASEGESA